ncbi:Mini-ribonuclease 3 [Paracholeplasma manati]|uniref:Mini-ribonuclease 3 n=1 Tax=Paracholeplasma manati TaxID=591373 RepID=A0ABT2Y5D4_9MOLU|nr:ribonuclease III domain-containing protein [Paracholeplasma manati]MCV2231658.1 ribonuclease III [Paracholeplasma manati]MDG0888599.1 ribonuclease III domain-containing protein [Paracholeplasma manati]
MEAHLINGVALAYIGDAYYELRIRKHLLSLGITKVNELHKSAIKFTAGAVQATLMDAFIERELLTETEISYFKKGRNASGPGRKNIDMATYHKSTGFESMMGYLYLTDIARCDALIDQAIQILTEKV